MNEKEYNKKIKELKSKIQKLKEEINDVTEEYLDSNLDIKIGDIVTTKFEISKSGLMIVSEIIYPKCNILLTTEPVIICIGKDIDNTVTNELCSFIYPLRNND